MKRHAQQRGFSVTELMIVLTIVAILLGIAVPSFRYITNSYRMSAEVNSLLGDMMYARSEAIKEGQDVTVCASANGATCSGASTWQSGWVVYPNPNNALANPAAGSILRLQTAFTGTTPDSFVANPALSAITYNREGFGTTAGGFPNNTTIVLHDPTANSGWTRCLWLTPQGVPSTETPAVDTSGTCLE
jgi:type IV fimbrial biogenesis protein FimT